MGKKSVRRIGYSSLIYKHIEKLPMASKLLKQICESVEMFHMRRIKIEAEHLHEKKSTFQKWELVKAAGIRESYENKLDVFIDEIVNKYNC